jgi:hypothetical protein
VASEKARAAVESPLAQQRAISAEGVAAVKGLADPRPSAAEVEERLAEEVLILDKARRALAANAPGLALRHADAYLARFPAGRQKPEARYLKMRALKAQGQAQRAEIEAKYLLNDEAGNLHRREAKEVLNED